MGLGIAATKATSIWLWFPGLQSLLRVILVKDESQAEGGESLTHHPLGGHRPPWMQG